MISVTAGGGVIRKDVQDAIRRELDYRLGEGDAPGALSRWQKELLLLVINAVRVNACLTQLHARAAIKAGANLAQVLDTILYIELTGMVKWVMVGYEAYTAAETEVPETERTKTESDAWAGQEQRFEEIKASLDSDELKKFFANQGAEPDHLGPSDFRSFLVREIALWQRVVKEAGIPVSR